MPNPGRALPSQPAARLPRASLPTPCTQLCEESGLDLAQEIKRAQKRKERLAAAKLSGGHISWAAEAREQLVLCLLECMPGFDGMRAGPLASAYSAWQCRRR